MRLYRLTSRRGPMEAFSGEGARRVAGRWHTVGVPVVYTSESVALALLETLIHIDTDDLHAITFVYAVDVPDALIETPLLSELPPDWNHPKRSDDARAYGREWATSNRSLGLAVPSIVVPQERNVLLNPAHPAFPTLPFGGPTAFAFDQRLLLPSTPSPRTSPPAGRRNPRRR